MGPPPWGLGGFAPPSYIVKKCPVINLGKEVCYYKAEIPKFSPQNNCKTVRTVDKTRIEYLNCREKMKKYIFLVSHPGITQISPH